MIKTLPLEGLKVLDLSRVLAGPLCTMMLADMGAHVIKVERPGSGDDTRGWGPPFAEDGQSAYFRSVNRNKLSVALDFRQSDDLAQLHQLIAGADVVIDNFLPGALAHVGIGRQAALERHPRLIWCTISGFGAESARPGYDYVVQAEAGWMAITGPVDGPPMKTGVAFVDIMTGKDAAASVLAAVIGLERGLDINRAIDISLMASATAALANVAQNALVSGADARRWGNAHPNLVPYQLFETADRPIVITVGSDAQWPFAANAVGLEAMADDPELTSNAGRLEHRERLVRSLGEQLITQPATFWLERLTNVGVPCGIVRSVAEVLADTPKASAVTGVPPIGYGRVRLNPPHLNEHGKEICIKHWSAFDQLPIIDHQGV